MSDVGAIGVILDELITVLESFEFDSWEEDKVVFGIQLLKYVGYLASKEGIDLEMEHTF